MSVCLVTGANGAIGEAIARGLATGGHEVVLVCRDPRRAERAVAGVRRASGNANVRYEIADLSRRSSVGALTERWRGELHVLVNNAAIAPRRRTETPEGIELQLATNVLGYLWMTSGFTEILARSAPARVVDVASYWAGDLAIDDLQFQRRRYDNGTAYRQSKQANRMLAVAQARRLRDRGITVNVCHPGDVNSTLSNALGFGGHEAPEEGADTPVWLATDPSVANVTGRYFAHRRPTPCPFGADEEAVEALWRACAAYDRDS